jgi:erythronate-4-phosphate dehydrogenase
MLRIIADDKIPFLKGILEPYASIEYLPAQNINREVLRNADALLIRTLTKCNKSLLDGTSVKFIATATIGFDHIDTDYCEQRNINWVNAPGCNSSAVQQYWLAAILTLAEKYHLDLTALTLGIVGVGNVGAKVEKAARLLGMKVILNDPPRARTEGPEKFVPFAKILESSDIITIHVPLNWGGEDNTFHLFDNLVLDKMKKSSFLINTSRGEVVETGSLKMVLSEGKLAGALLDVWENEPSIDRELLGKVIISTPHIAGYSLEGKANATVMICNSFLNFFGLPAGISLPTLPPPHIPIILPEKNKISCPEIARQAVFHTYPVMDDHIRLQKSPASFEQQRGNYHFRREFPAYTVRFDKDNNEATEILEALGFSVYNKL